MQDLSKAKLCASEYRRNNLAEKETKDLKIFPEPCFVHAREDDHTIILRPDDKSDLAKHIREKRSFRQCPNCGWLVSCPKI